MAIVTGPTASAQETSSSQGLDAADQFAMQSSLQTRIGFVLTGDMEVDATSRMGLEGLGRVLQQRTSIEPAEPVAIDLQRDIIVFFPVISGRYWPTQNRRMMRFSPNCRII